MGIFRTANEGTPAAPSSGFTRWVINTVTKRLQTVDDANYRRTLGYVNGSTAAQAPAASTRTYIAGSNIVFAAGSLQVLSMFRWTFNMTKTAAGIAASTFDICLGTLGTTGDTARVSFTKPAGTAVVDEGKVIIEAILRGPIGASGVLAGHFTMTHNLAATGHAIIPCVDVQVQSAGFDVTAPTNIGVCITSGAADAITIQQVIAEAWNL